MCKIVVALGGNAILQPGQKGLYEEQLENIRLTCRQLARLVRQGHKLVITHGNGPQVGNLLLQNEIAGQHVPAMPLDVLGAQSQGMIGYMIQNELRRELGRPDNGQVATVITQVVVDEADRAFSEPAKPVGLFLPEEEAFKAMKERGETWIEDSGRGWRRAVASPEPKEIVEKQVIKALVDQGATVISVGGGGIPVVKRDGGYQGIEAVVDKDLAAEKLACEIGADILLILTDVANVMLHYRTSREERLETVTGKELRRYFEEGHFKKGSMEPKVRACLRFVGNAGRRAIITSIDKAADAVAGKAGTIISEE